MLILPYVSCWAKVLHGSTEIGSSSFHDDQIWPRFCTELIVEIVIIISFYDARAIKIVTLTVIYDDRITAKKTEQPEVN